ncbi:hypothetical protein JCM10450v2_006053 [Rhodotorula kratochvilovae]
MSRASFPKCFLWELECLMAEAAYAAQPSDLGTLLAVSKPFRIALRPYRWAFVNARQRAVPAALLEDDGWRYVEELWLGAAPDDHNHIHSDAALCAAAPAVRSVTFCGGTSELDCVFAALAARPGLRFPHCRRLVVSATRDTDREPTVRAAVVRTALACFPVLDRLEMAIAHRIDGSLGDDGGVAAAKVPVSVLHLNQAFVTPGFVPPHDVLVSVTHAATYRDDGAGAHGVGMVATLTGALGHLARVAEVAVGYWECPRASAITANNLVAFVDELPPAVTMLSLHQPDPINNTTDHVFAAAVVRLPSLERLTTLSNPDPCSQEYSVGIWRRSLSSGWALTVDRVVEWW